MNGAMRSVLVVGCLLLLSACGGEPLWFVPGGKLAGDVTPPPASWDNVPETIQVETNPDDPYSINIWSVGIGQNLYIATSPEGTNWSQKILANPNVRVRVDGKLHSLRAESVEDPVERADVLDAYIQKYDVDKEGSFVEEGLIFRFE